MGHTTHRDLKLAVEMLGTLGEHPGPAALAEAGVRRLPALVGSELTTLSVCTLHNGHRSVICNPAGAISAGDIACFDRFFFEHPLVLYHARNPDGTAYRISDSQPSRIFKRTALYNDYYRNVGIDHAIAVPLFVDSSLLVSFVLNRKGRDFSDRDREVLDLVRRPLAALYRNALALDGIQQALSKLTAAGYGGGADWMLVALDRSRRITGVAPRIEPWFGRACAGSGPGRPLPAPLDRDVAAQFAAIDNACTVAAPDRVAMAGDAACTVQVLWRGDATRDALVLIRRQGRGRSDRRVPPALTAREREVLQWVAAGKTNAQIADILVASPRTVGKHLENIYSKLGVETRTAAVNRGIADTA